MHLLLKRDLCFESFQTNRKDKVVEISQDSSYIILKLVSIHCISLSQRESTHSHKGRFDLLIFHQVKEV